LFPEEQLNKYNPGSLPQHELRLKVWFFICGICFEAGVPLMLLRNVNLYEGLANGTRMRLLEVSKSKKVIKVEVMTGPKANKAFSKEERTFPLFRIPCTNGNDRHMPMKRIQFPVRVTYSMSINKV